MCIKYFIAFQGIYYKIIYMDLSVVIHCLNEEKSIVVCIEKCFNSFYKLRISGEVIVFDNGSTDNSAQISLNNGVKLLIVPKKDMAML